MRVALFVLAFFLGVAAAAPTASALRCGRELVGSGDTLQRVRRACGEPIDVSVRIEQIAVNQRVGNFIITNTNTVVIETWTINFGPRRLMQRIVFHDGCVYGISSLGYGYPHDTVRVPGRHVRVGDDRSRVLAHWGEPSERISEVIVQRSFAGGQAVVVSQTSQVQVDTWTFDFGPQRLMRRVTFADGRVQSIEVLGRGGRY